MTAKEYLSQARILDNRINTKLDRVSRLRALAQKMTTNLGSEPVAHTRNVSSMEDLILRVLEQEQSLNEEIDRFVDLKQEIDGVISEVKDEDCEVLLEMRYLCYRSWEEIADSMNLHIRTVFKIHSRGLQKVDAILKRKKLNFEKWAVKGTCGQSII